MYNMKIKGATTVLKKDAKFLGLTWNELMQFIERNPLAQNIKTLEAHEVYMMDQAYYWKGTQGDTWIKRETA